MIRATCNMTLFFAGLAFVLLPSASEAQIWTHTAHTCVVDDVHSSGTPLTASDSLRVQRAGTVRARCNVTNPMDDGQAPNWGVLDIVYTDPPPAASNERVTAILWRINNDGTLPFPIVAFSSDNFPQAAAAQMRSMEFSHVFDFAEAAYFVEITLTEHGVGFAGTPRRKIFLVRLRPAGPR